ncbi:Hypothetical protein ING2D1G_0724 [Peptoniphilus sp. ING2-D1G]|nr:Hypothetical protein ING2D1G_0724 [Peptoniphilus sp. ING2-D1G]
MTVHRWGKYQKKSNYRTVTKTRAKERVLDFASWIEYEDALLYAQQNIDSNPQLYNDKTNVRPSAKSYIDQSGNTRYYPVVLYDEYYTEQVFSHYSQGSYIGTVTSTNRNAYPDNNYSGSYWYVYEGIDNQAPVISGSDLDLGSKVEDFNIEYIVQDADGNPCTVDITVDTVKKVSAKSVTLGAKYTYPISINEFTLGKHTVVITAKDSNNATSTRTYNFTKSNTAPVISGTDEDLGGKSTAFTQNYKVTDSNNDDVSVVITLDDTEIATVTSAQNKDLSVTITDVQLNSMEIGSVHTITIKADDGKGGVAYRRYIFTKINRPPIISGTNTDLGDKKEPFTIEYSVTDIEKDKVYLKIYLDGVEVFENSAVEDGSNYTYTIPVVDFLKLRYEQHEIKIEAWDDFSVDNKQVRTYTFERVSAGLEVEIKINEFDIQPKKIIAVPHGIFASDADMKVFACNNYNDTTPTWEDMTDSSKAARAYAFTNTTKTASKWAIGIKVIVENGTSAVSSVLRGFKGGYE